MLYVVFTQLNHSKIQKYEKIPFDEAVKLSAELEMEMRRNKEKVPGVFSVIDSDNDNEALYAGTFNFGSYFAPNLYMHIMKNLPKIKRFGNKEKANKQIEFMRQMDNLISDDYKQEEDIDEQLFQNVDKDKISHLKKWQRWTVYVLGLFFAIAFVGTLSFFFIQIAAINADYHAMEKQLSSKEKSNNYYADALLGDEDKLKKYLSTKNNKLTDQEKKLSAMFLANDEEYEKLVQLYNGDAKKVANFLSKNAEMDKLKAFNEEYPTNEAKFDIAYADKDYDKALSIDNYDVTPERSKKKTYAFLKTGKLDEAKKELENNNDEDLQKKVTKYEDLDKKINDLNDKIKNDSKKDKRKHKKEKEKLEKEQSEI